MLNITKKLMEQDYRPVTEIKKGDRIYLNYAKKNGILVVDHLESVENSMTTRWGTIKPRSYLHIITDKYEIKLKSNLEIPKVEDGWIIRSVPNSGQYYLMNGWRFDNKSKELRSPVIKLIDEKVEVEPFNDWCKFYSDSKTKDYIESNKTSTYSKDHQVSVITKIHKPGEKYSRRERVIKIKHIEFDYDKNNFLIPYKFSNIIGTFIIPDDVKVIGTRCFSNFDYLDKIILPNHEVRFKKGALLCCNFLPEFDITFNKKLDGFKMNGGELLKGNISSFNIYKYHEGTVRKSMRMDDLPSNDYINPNKLRIGMRLRMPVLVDKNFGNSSYDKVVTERRNSVLMDIKDGIYVFDIGNYKINEETKSFRRVS